MIEEIKNKLLEKNINDTSINKYIRDLILLNNNKQFSNLNFLKNKDKINNYIEDNYKYKDTTKKNYYSSINTILLLYLPKYKQLQEYYYNKFNEYNNKVKSNINILPDYKKDKYINYNDILDIYNNVKNKVDEFKNNEELNKEQYNILLSFFVFSLYILINPRRNNDYLQMMIIKNKPKLLENKYNYLLLNKKKFIFNNYKTSKTYNQQIINIPDELYNIILLYLKHHKLYNNSDNELIPLLISYKGLILDNNSSINEILKKINKNLNSTLLRHSYINYKFKPIYDEQKETSNNMAHSKSMQEGYLYNNI